MTSQDVRIPIDGIELVGSLAIPAHPSGVVIFAHSSGSCRHNPRNEHVAQILHSRGLATLLVDLWTADEEQIDALDTALRFDVHVLAERLIEVTDSILVRGPAKGMPVAYFGGTTGAAIALIAAARRPASISAVVSRGGRMDLAYDILAQVTAPTLLIVGARDPAIIAGNREAATRLHAPHRIEIVAGATHLFEEPGALDRVANLAADWFVQQFSAARSAA